MTYGLEIYGGTHPTEELLFSTSQGDTFLKKVHKASFGPASATAPIVIGSIPTELNRTNSVICVSVTDSTVEILGNARAIFTGPETLDGAGEITIPKCAESGTITGFIEVLQYEGMELAPDTFGLLVTDPTGDLIIDHNSLVWGVQYGGTLQDQGWFGYENNDGEYGEYRIVHLPENTFAVNQPFGIAVKKEDWLNEWVVQPDFLIERGQNEELEYYTAIRFHRRAGETSDLHFIVVVPADETTPPLLEVGDFGLEIYGPTGDLGWSSRWFQAVVKKVHFMNTGFAHTVASPINDYDLEPGYDGVDPPVALGTGGYSESSQSLRSRGRSAKYSEPNNIVWPFDPRVRPSRIYTLFSTGTGYIQYYKGMKTLDGSPIGLEGGGRHCWSTKVGPTGYVIDMFRLGDGPEPSGPSQYSTRAFPGYHPTGHAIFLHSPYVGPVLLPDTFCVTGRQIEAYTTYAELPTNHYASSTGFFPEEFTEFTFVCCFKPYYSGLTGNLWGTILELINSNSFYIFSLYWENDGDIDFGADLTDGYAYFGTSGGAGGVVLNQWNSLYVTVRLNPTAGTFDGSIWLNGVEEVTVTGDDAFGNGVFIGHNTVISTMANEYSPNPYDISFIWADTQYLDPVTNYSKFFNGSVPKNPGVDGSVPTGTQPLNYFPDGSLTHQYGSLADSNGYSYWLVSPSGWIQESTTNPTGCPQKLDGGDKGGMCVTGRVLVDNGVDYYESDTGFINTVHWGFTFICGLKEGTNVAQDGYWYSTSPDGNGDMPFFIGRRSNGNFWIGFQTNAGENIEWEGDIGLSTTEWSRVYITAFIRDNENELDFEIWNNASQKIYVRFYNILGTQLLPHGTNGPAYLGKGVGTGDPGVNMEISYIYVDDEYWYQGEYYDEFFDSLLHPLPLGSGSDEATGQIPQVYYPSGSPVKYVEVGEGLWEVVGWIAESDTNISGCPKRNDGGDGGPGFPAARYFDLRRQGFYYTYNSLIPPEEEAKHNCWVFSACIYVEPPGSEWGTLLDLRAQYLLGSGYGVDLELDEFGQLWLYGRSGDRNVASGFAVGGTPETAFIYNDWNKVVFAVYLVVNPGAPNLADVYASICLNGVYIAPYLVKTNVPSDGFIDGYVYPPGHPEHDLNYALMIGVDWWDLVNGYQFNAYMDYGVPYVDWPGISIALSNIYNHVYTSVTPPNAADIYDLMFDTAGLPKNIGENGQAVLGEIPLHYFLTGTWTENKGSADNSTTRVNNFGVIPEYSSNPAGVAPYGLPDSEGPIEHDLINMTTSSISTSDENGCFMYFDRGGYLSWWNGTSWSTQEWFDTIHAYLVGDYNAELIYGPYIMKVDYVSGPIAYAISDRPITVLERGETEIWGPPLWGVWLEWTSTRSVTIGIDAPNEAPTGNYTLVFDVSFARNHEAGVFYKGYNPTEGVTINYNPSPIPGSIVTKRITVTDIHEYIP